MAQRTSSLDIARTILNECNPDLVSDLLAQLPASIQAAVAHYLPMV